MSLSGMNHLEIRRVSGWLNIFHERFIFVIVAL